uniref:BUB1 mitotic checkpoint serine/threonine kinase n=2 Tax=Cyclopterus lumpus TaxID=8103 RepID=A0A8C2XLF4_CYCLU
MDMFQAPTLLEDPLSRPSLLHDALSDFQPGSSYSAKPATSLTVFQDEPDKENAGAEAPPPLEKSKPIRALAEIQSNKPNESPVEPTPDESTMWGPRYNSLNSLHACPNSTSDFAMLAQFVSTPFTHKAPFSFYEEDQENCDGKEAEAAAFLRRQPKKLSPIMELSPSNDAAFSQLLPAAAAHGTIVGEGLASAPHCLTSSITMVEAPPPGVLSFRDQTPTCPADWDVYTSPAPPPPPQPEASVGPRREPFTIMEDLDRPASPERVQRPPAGDVPMSPEGAARSPEPDLDVILRPRLLAEVDLDVPVSPHRPQLCAGVPMSPMPAPFGAEDEPMMSPDVGGLRPHATDVSMNAAEGEAAAVQLVSDPWDEDRIAHLLSSLSPPLTSHPRCITWSCKVPNICPKTTISMGKASLRVDCVLGEGAFATVYQATDPLTSERTVLKVQKPANPWEFYVNLQLDARLQPDVRRLFSTVHAAHLFHDGSVLLGELHNHGTLLNAVNIYKTLSDKVMPQPLVMYFAVCILHMVEQLHAVHVIHADIKPDNFLLGERFLDNKCFDPENLDHGLVLIDLGQSIDMELFPEGTAFTAKCLTSGFQCTEMLSGKPWSYQTDYFGLAGTVHCLLFGTYMQVKNEGGVWKTNGVFRRNPHSDLWQDFFHALLNAPGGAAPLVLRSLRRSLASALKQNYGSKLPALKSRMMVLLLENRRAARR